MMFPESSRLVEMCVTLLYCFLQGFLEKRSPGFIQKWADRWCILKPTMLQYYSHRDERDLKGTIEITQTTRAGVSTD